MPPFPRTYRAALAALTTLLALSLTVPTPSAAAGTYIHRSCITGTDVSDGGLGWQPFAYNIPGSQTLMRCGLGGGLYTEQFVSGQLPHGEGGGWTYKAPVDTTISRITGSLAGWTSGWNGGQGLLQIVDPTGVHAEFTGMIDPQHPRAFDIDDLDARWTTLQAICDPLGAACTNNVAWASFYEPEIHLVDRSDPTVGAFGGTLTTDERFVGDERLSFTVSDTGGGIARLRLYVDGQRTSVDHVIDDNDDRCVASGSRDGAWVFAVPRPCPLVISAVEVVDTTKIADGLHTLTVTVVDAAQHEKNVWSGTRVVANRPPIITRLPSFRDSSVLTTALIGTAIEAISDGLWSGPNLTVIRNWVRCDAQGSESSCVDVAGATGLTYTPSTADVGHRMRLRVTASNVAGTTKIFTAPSGVVAAPRTSGGSTPDPTPVPDPTPDPSPDPAPGPGVVPPGSSPVTNSTITSPLPVAAVPVATAHALVGHVVGEAGGVGCPQEKATLKFQRVTGGVVKLGYGRTSTVQLQLMCTNNGKAIEGARLDVGTRVGSRPAVASDVTTDGAGRALIRLASGPGRAITVGYRMYADDPFARATAALKVSVNGRVSLRGDHRKLRNGKALRLRGRLLGGYVPRRGVTLTVQWKDHKRWRPFAQIKTTKKGTFSYAYRFTRTNRPITYTLRVQATKGQLDYPFLPVASNPVKVTVMP